MAGRERARVLRAIDEMAANPLAGDVVKLKGQTGSFRRRAGDWRIFFDAYPDQRTVHISEIVRRTTTTYRKRH